MGLPSTLTPLQGPPLVKGTIRHEELVTKILVTPIKWETPLSLNPPLGVVTSTNFMGRPKSSKKSTPAKPSYDSPKGIYKVYFTLSPSILTPNSALDQSVDNLLSLGQPSNGKLLLQFKFSFSFRSSSFLLTEVPSQVALGDLDSLVNGPPPSSNLPRANYRSPTPSPSSDSEVFLSPPTPYFPHRSPPSTSSLRDHFILLTSVFIPPQSCPHRLSTLPPPIHIHRPIPPPLLTLFTSLTQVPFPPFPSHPLNLFPPLPFLPHFP